MHADVAAVSRTLGETYLIERELGRGGMGTVYLARDRRLDRPVALKVLPPEFASVADLRERFLRETRLAAGFSHPNIVPVFAVEESDEVLAFAMGFVEGESLSARVTRDGPLSRRDTVRLLQDVGYALAYAHGRGVVHRDIKPDNIMIERATGRALVMDFGIARAITPVNEAAGLTRIGEVVGTPEYMSPEQATGDTVDGRSDLYSLGLVAWFATTGRTAMMGESTQRILVRQLTEAVPSVTTFRTDLPKALSDVIDTCCAKEPAARFQTAEALVEALDATQLATPEIPVAIRLLAPELSTASTRAVVAFALLLNGTGMVLSNGNGNMLAIGVIVFAMFWVGLVTALREVGRLRGMGFDVAEIQRLLALTLAERDEERARRATDVTLVKRRTTRMWISAGLAIWLASRIVTIRFGDEVSVRGEIQGTAQTIMFFASLLGLAAAITVLVSSPFRRTVAEHLFSFFWLGRLGRMLLSIRGPRASAADGAASSTRVTAASSKRVDTDVSLAGEVAALRDRVDALERRR
ncbi:MAG: serine/threonine protein kinase [Gemmatimonadaceae bacterium]|nr:serine/threonine protein kinase [Gemmatimonadaceae bacterium]